MATTPFKALSIILRDSVNIRFLSNTLYATYSDVKAVYAAVFYITFEPLALLCKCDARQSYEPRPLDVLRSRRCSSHGRTGFLDYAIQSVWGSSRLRRARVRQSRNPVRPWPENAHTKTTHRTVRTRDTTAFNVKWNMKAPYNSRTNYKQWGSALVAVTET